MKNIKFFEDFTPSNLDQNEQITEGHEGHDLNNYMFFQNLFTIKGAIEDLLEMDPSKVDEILSDGHGWALDHIATSVDDIEEVYHFLSNTMEMGGEHSEHHGEDHKDEEGEEKSEIEVEIEGDNGNIEIESEEE